MEQKKKIVFPDRIDKFIDDNSIPKNDVVKIVSNSLIKIPESVVSYDISTYREFGILKVTIESQNIKLEPLLFGTIKNLSSLNRRLWEESSSSWSKEMKSIEHPGTFLKKIILIGEILRNFNRYYPDNGSVLDLGCGDGVLFKELIKISKNIYGIDFAAPFIHGLQKDLPDYADHFEVMDGLKITLEESFDVIIACTYFLGIIDIDKALNSCFANLEDNGIILIADINSRYHRSMGYYDSQGSFHTIHDPNSIIRIEKMIGGGKSKAIHNNHPYDYYRNHLEELGMVCLLDKEIIIDTNHINERDDLDAFQKENLLKRLKKYFSYPPFRILILKKQKPNRID